VAEVSNDFAGSARPRGAGYDIGAYESPFSTQVRDLRIANVSGDAPNLTVSLNWTAPIGAVAYALRSNEKRISTDNWDSCTVIPLSLSPSPPGTREQVTVPVYQAGEIVYIVLRVQTEDETWSEVSNNAFWPQITVYLPIVVRQGL